MSENNDKKIIGSVPYVYFEAACARQERTIKRLWITSIIMFSAFLASNCAWLLHYLR